MRLYELIQEVEWEKVKEEVDKILEEVNVDESSEDFEEVFNLLRNKDKSEIILVDDVKILVEKYEDWYNNDDHYITTGKTEEGESFSLEFAAWNEWLGMEVKEVPLSSEKIVAECLWEMTFCGFDEKTRRLFNGK